jgi:hypothetical protein
MAALGLSRIFTRSQPRAAMLGLRSWGARAPPPRTPCLRGLCSGAPPPPTAAPSAAAAPPNADARAFEGPKATLLQVLKACSAANLALSLLSAPAAVLLSTAGTPTTRLMLMSTVVVFSVSTTAMLHYATKSYVLALHKAGEGRVRVETVTFWGGRSSRVHHLDALGPAGDSALFANLAARETARTAGGGGGGGGGSRGYYLDPVGQVLDEATMRAVYARAELASGSGGGAAAAR